MRIAIGAQKLLARALVPTTLLLMALFPTRPLQAQSAAMEGMGTEFPELFPENAVIHAKTSAALAAWNPGTLRGLITVHYEYPEGYHQIDDPVYFTLKPKPAPGIIFSSPLKAKPAFKDGIAEYYGETSVLIEFQASRNAQHQTLSVNALSQICNNQGVCLLPNSELHHVYFDPAAPTLKPNEETLAILDWSARGEGGAAALTNTAVPEGMPPGKVFLILLSALIGGILLNIMPCVLPILSIKALNLVNQAEQSKKAIFTHSLLYAAGIEVSLLALAAVVIALQTSGRLLGWGFQFQSPLFVLILIAIIWVFALSLFNVFVIEAPREKSSVNTGGGFGRSFLTGMLAVLIAAPCTAPLLGAVLGFAFSQTAPMIIAIFALIGLGFGLPFLLVGIGLGEKFPRPGPWMNTFKEVMGFVLIGIAFYLLTTFVKLAPKAVGGALWWLFFLGFSAWLLGKARGPLVKRVFRFTGQILALIIAVGSGFLLIDLSDVRGTGPGAAEISRWPDEANRELLDRAASTIAFSQQELQSLTAVGKPVFLEFSADWCTTCKINQRVIRHREIRSLMTQKGIIHMKADLTAYDEELTRVLAGYGRASLPLYVLHRPDEEEPHIFPAFISVRKLTIAMQEIR